MDKGPRFELYLREKHGNRYNCTCGAGYATVRRKNGAARLSEAIRAICVHFMGRKVPAWHDRAKLRGASFPVGE